MNATHRSLCRLGVTLALLSLAVAAHAEPAALAGADGTAQLATVAREVTGQAGAATTHPVLVWTQPPVDGERYALTGVVDYRGVDGDGYLEMWSHFGARGSYFSRTLAAAGPLAVLRGDANARRFSLPFDTGGEAPAPERIEFNVVLPGAGHVAVRDLEWVSSAELTGATVNDSAWWNARSASLGGAACGALLGMIGALYGVLARSERAHRVLRKGLWVIAAAAFGALATAAVAGAADQPFHVIYPLLLCGGLAAALAAGMSWALRRHQNERELRKMRAFDLDVSPSPPQH